MIRFSKQAILTLLSAAIFNFSAFSQDANQNLLNGRISDANGASLSGVNVVARNLARGEECATQTGSDGNFGFENLPSGKYRVTFESAGFSSGAREVSLGGSQSETLEIALSIGNISENMTVTATRPRAGTSREIF